MGIAGLPGQPLPSTPGRFDSDYLHHQSGRRRRQPSPALGSTVGIGPQAMNHGLNVAAATALRQCLASGQAYSDMDWPHERLALTQTGRGRLRPG